MATQDKLPSDVNRFIEYLAQRAAAYDNHLQPTEQSRFKAELMNSPRRWHTVDAGAFLHRALELGMTYKDAGFLHDCLMKAQAGRRLVPDPFERYYTWPADPPPIRESA